MYLLEVASQLAQLHILASETAAGGFERLVVSGGGLVKSRLFLRSVWRISRESAGCGLFLEAIYQGLNSRSPACKASEEVTTGNAGCATLRQQLKTLRTDATVASKRPHLSAA